MAKKNDTTFFENKLPDFVTAKDPMLEMLQWVMDKFMEIEVAHKTGAEKGIHAQSRTGYRCGYRIRRFDTRPGTVYLSVPKLRQGGYIPFFVTEKKRSEQALIQVVQECRLNGVSTRKIEHIAKKLGIESLSTHTHIQLFSEGSRNADLRKSGCAFPMHTRDFRRRYALPCRELPGRDVRFISCGIYLHMFGRKTRKKLAQDRSLSGKLLMKNRHEHQYA